MTFPLHRVPNVPLRIIASQLDDDSFRNLRKATQAIPHMLAITNTEFGLRFCRNLDVIVLGTSLTTTNNHLSPHNANLRVSARGTLWGRQVRSINFHRGDPQRDQLIAQNARVVAITTLLSRTPRADTVFIRTHTAIASGVLFPALQQTPTTTFAIRHLTISSDANIARLVRVTRQQVLALLTKHRLTLETLTLDTAMLSAADWAPILVYIRDQMNLRSFTFYHCPHNTVAAQVPVPIFTLQPHQNVTSVFPGIGEDYDFFQSTGVMNGFQGVKRGANRLLFSWVFPAAHDPNQLM